MSSGMSYRITSSPPCDILAGLASRRREKTKKISLVPARERILVVTPKRVASVWASNATRDA